MHGYVMGCGSDCRPVLRVTEGQVGCVDGSFSTAGADTDDARVGGFEEER